MSIFQEKQKHFNDPKPLVKQKGFVLERLMTELSHRGRFIILHDATVSLPNRCKQNIVRYKLWCLAKENNIKLSVVNTLIDVVTLYHQQRVM